MIVWFKISESRRLPGKVISENVFDMGYLEIESLENGKKYLVKPEEIIEVISKN